MTSYVRTEQEVHQSPADATLHRGTLLLQSLERKAEAIRLEAQIAELRQAIEQAQLGYLQTLETWIRQFDESGDSVQPLSFCSPAWPDNDGEKEQGSSQPRFQLDFAREKSPAFSTSWQALLPHARSRLQLLLNQSTRQRIEQLEHFHPASDPVNEPVAPNVGELQIGHAPESHPLETSIRRTDSQRPSQLESQLESSQALEPSALLFLARSLCSPAVSPNLDHMCTRENVSEPNRKSRKQQLSSRDAQGRATVAEQSLDVEPFEQAVACDEVSNNETSHDANSGSLDSAESLNGFVLENRSDGSEHEVELTCAAIQAFAGEVAIDPNADRPKKSAWGSMAVSLIGHGALLLMLASITYTLPRESASLGSQVVSVQQVSENVESSSQFESPEPVELNLPENELSAAISSEVVSESVMAMSSEDLSAALSSASPSSSSSPASSSLMSALQSGSSSGRSSGPPPASSSSGGKFFGTGSGGNYFCYVVDSSGSMRGEAWDLAKAELIRSLKTLSETQKFYIIFFAKEFTAIPLPGEREPATTGLYATPENIEHAKRWIATVKLDRGGPPTEALKWAIEREPDAIYLLTDGVTSVDVCGYLAKHNRTEDFISGLQVTVPIHSIAYHSLDGQSLMRRLAQENAGQFHYVPPPKK